MIEKKPPSKIDAIKNNKRLHVFLLFLMMSFLYWTLIKLSKDYISEVQFELVFTDVPKNKLLQKPPEKTIDLTIKTIGFKLLKYNFKRKTLKYSLAEIKNKKGAEYFSMTKANMNNLQAQLSAETVVLKISPDTLYFDLGVKKSKKVKVISDVNLQFKPGFNLIKDYTIEPEFVTISGPSNVIDTIHEVKTTLLEWMDISTSFDKKINLQKPNNAVALSEDQVTIKGEVEKITEGSFSLPFQVINLPKNHIISTYPKEVKVVYQVALKDYNKISENSFVIQCDYRHTEQNNLEYLIPKIVEKPEILFDVKLIPNKVEFLIKK